VNIIFCEEKQKVGLLQEHLQSFRVPQLVRVLKSTGIKHMPCLSITPGFLTHL